VSVEPLPVAQKALRMNLDPAWFGTLAEVGAGQEVARCFFAVGGAAGTIAKSISAYDMTVSDGIYGKSARHAERPHDAAGAAYVHLREHLFANDLVHELRAGGTR